MSDFLERLLVATICFFLVVLIAAPAWAAGVAAPAHDARVVAVLVAGAAAVKLTMTLLDVSGALGRLPPWLRPHVTLVLAALVGSLQAVAGGVDVYVALAGSLGSVVVSDKSHQTILGAKKHELWKSTR